MKRIAVLAIVLSIIAIGVLAVPVLAQGPVGGNPPNGYGWMGGMMGGFLPGQAITPTMPFGYGRGGMMGGGMMGGFVPSQAITPTMPFGYGRGGMMGGFVPSQAITPTMPFGYGRGGMMGGGMMGNFRRGGMMRGYGYAPNAQAITLDKAVTNAQQYVAAYNNSDLKLAEIEEYSGNFYGVVKEKSTGINAFQILIDKYSGAVYPEIGPNMMWNTKYSPMISMMGGALGQSAGKMTVTLDQACTNASLYLKTNLPNTTAEDKGDMFYGYYNLDVLQNGKTVGMLSVNGYTGQVWYHTWHGNFISAKSIE